MKLRCTRRGRDPEGRRVGRPESWEAASSYSWTRVSAAPWSPSVVPHRCLILFASLTSSRTGPRTASSRSGTSMGCEVRVARNVKDSAECERGGLKVPECCVEGARVATD